VDPAIAPEQIARPLGQPQIVEALIVEMTIHAVEPGQNPAASRLEKGDAAHRMSLAHAQITLITASIISIVRGMRRAVGSEMLTPDDLRVWLPEIFLYGVNLDHHVCVRGL